ncbi:hypothetical protein H4W81_001760 [Nonomuraea africana]|uniref:Uncharacterized protein n=1 Tax=Nonomuraea africana TaxID=46171 RepID=A0ABR9KAE7_9ACTN|nr:hypothetical protein [Nonomuraea africana]
MPVLADHRYGEIRHLSTAYDLAKDKLYCHIKSERRS